MNVARTKRVLRPRALSGHRRPGPSLRDTGQAALGIVLGLTLMLVTGASLLATDAVQHDPLVQADLVQHYAYRAVEAGVNTYLSEVNANSNLINCWHGSPNGGQCTDSNYLTWEQVDGTTAGNVPEWYLWGNPQFCFSANCQAAPGPGSQLDHVQVVIYGAAGFPGHMVYEHTAANFTPANGFLTRVWWSNYEATDPNLTGNPQTACTWDWANSYFGPSVTAGACQAVEFFTGDKLYGPIFSNDSIYVNGDPTLGPVTTDDSQCLFVTAWSNPLPRPMSSWCYPNAAAAVAAGVVGQTGADSALSADNQPFQPLPQDDTKLATYAQLDGCLYQGPTVITFDNATGGPPGTGHMTVVSPDTTAPQADGLTCVGNDVPIPNGTNGNGVIYVETAASGCVPGANPFDNWTSGNYGPNAQLNYHGSYANYAGASGKPDCEADAFMSDNPGVGGPPSLPNALPGGVVGQLTVATENDVVITGNLQYPSDPTDCGNNFDSTVNNQCVYNPTGSMNNNDMLGLIAQNYVEVNHPVKPACNGGNCNGPGTLQTACTKAQLGTPTGSAIPLCDPGGNNGLIVDAAILALSNSFLVNNWTAGSPTQSGLEPGNLTVYGSIAQDWRGAVGLSGSTGYVKDYDWDSRAEYLSPPYYLAPGTPSWQINSSATTLDLTTPPLPVGAAP